MQYILDEGTVESSLTGSAVMLSFMGRVCDKCRLRKRRCNGKVKGCIKYRPEEDPVNVRGVKRRNSFELVRIAPLPSKHEDPSPTSPEGIKPIAPIHSDLQDLYGNRHGMAFLWPSEEDSSWMHPSLDPLIMFMDNITHHDYFPLEGEPQVFLHQMQEEEKFIVQHFCDTTSPFLFEVFDRSDLIEQLESLPQMIRYAFYSFCAQFSDPPAPLPIRDKFYASSKCIARWCVENPGLSSFQALFMLFTCAGTRMDLEYAQFLHMAFRMASYLGMDTPKLLELPSKSEVTKRDMDLRDRCWNICLFHDSIGAEMSKEPRFFIHSASALESTNSPTIQFQYFSLLHISQSSYTFHLAMLSEEMLSVKTAIRTFGSQTDYTVFQNLSIAAEGRLISWKNSLPPSAALEWVDGWVRGGQTMDQKDVSRIELYLGYHACVCNLYRAKALNSLCFGNSHTRNPLLSFHSISDIDDTSYLQIEPLLSTAFKSALKIAKVAEKLRQFPKFHRYINPHVLYYFTVSGLLLCELCDRIIGAHRREDVARLLEAKILVMEGAECMWKMAVLWLPIMKQSLQLLRYPAT
ncbi:hypothetical protein HDU97_005689 [Phlyctochytrium planicorne]|nr:hypothetical protein HDU97_005689 [Phlyctochytrium planicorne]